MTVVPQPRTPTVAVARELRRLGLEQGRGKDFRVEGEYRNGERYGTLVLTLNRHADETIAANADLIEERLNLGPFAFHVSVYYNGTSRPMTVVSNTGSRVRETPPATADDGQEDALEPAAQPAAPAEEPTAPAAPATLEPPAPALAPAPETYRQRLRHMEQAEALGWSTGQAALVADAAAGRLRLDEDGTLRQCPVSGQPAARLAAYRLDPLVKAGFLAVTAPDPFGHRQVAVTADGRHALGAWRRWTPEPAPKNRKQDLEAVRPLMGGEEAGRRVVAYMEDEARRAVERDDFFAVAQQLNAWEERETRLRAAWAAVNGVRFSFARRPVGWVPTGQEAAEHHLDPAVVEELRADAAAPQLRPELPKTRTAPREELPPLDADPATAEQLDLFGMVGAQ